MAASANKDDVCSKITIRVPTKEDWELYDRVGDDIWEGEAISQAYPATSQQVENYLLQVCDYQKLFPHLSVMAFTEEEGLIGCRFAEDLAACNLATQFEDNLESFHASISLSLTSWWEHFGGKDSVKNNPGKIARFDGLAVHPKYRGIGLGRKMVEESMKILKANGFQKVVVDATGFYSAGLFKKMGFRVVKEFPYATLEVDGKKLFTKMEPPHFALTMLEQDL